MKGGGGQQRSSEAHRGHPAAAAQGARGDEAVSGERTPPHRERGVDAFQQAGEAVGDPGLQAVVEDDPGRGGVVVGQDDEGPVAGGGEKAEAAVLAQRDLGDELVAGAAQPGVTG